jgi:hypothetical protein
MRLPVHRWFRFSAGFSAAWAASLIRDEQAHGEVRVFDPFVGSGTTLIAAEDCGVSAYGTEAHPFIARIAAAKLARRSDPAVFKRRAAKTLDQAKATEAPPLEYPPLIAKCYTDAAIQDLARLSLAVKDNARKDPASELVWLAFVAILRQCSHAGTAQWQYVLPRKSKQKVIAPFDAFAAMCRTIETDMRDSAECAGPEASLVRGDARTCEGVPDRCANLVVTSPPYPNNYDYADATRLEMSFLQEIKGWGDLQDTVRQHLVRSCTQHVPERAANLDAILDEPILAPIADELAKVTRELARVRLTKGGKKTYHLMVACYFLDLAYVWRALRRVCDSPSKACFVIGDSAPYGIYVPVIEWLGKLAKAEGFDSYTFDRTRDRNVKWKNRKHRVPLCEGRLWVKG